MKNINGKNNPNFGHKWTKEQKERQSILTKERMTDNIKQLMRDNHYDASGENNPNYKHGKTNAKRYCYDCDKLLSKQAVLCNSKRCKRCVYIWKIRTGLLKGKNNPNYKDGRTTLGISIRNLSEYKIWRNKVFKRDNYTCQDCKQIGNTLNVHHEISFSHLLSEFLSEYNQFSPIEDKDILVRLAMNWKSFWNIDNGKTLCKNCHKIKEVYYE